MAARPVTTPSPEHPDATDELHALRAERDELEQRALEAEAVAEQLAEQLADAQRRLADGVPAADDRHLTLFDDAGPAERHGRLAPDGSDQAVLPIALGSTALVAFLIGALTILTGRFSYLTVIVLGVAGALAWAAVQTRVARVSVDVVDGVVLVVEGDTTRRFDLRNDSIKVDVQGSPGDAYWRVRFYRRALDPVDVDDTMVDPQQFMDLLRDYRPDL